MKIDRSKKDDINEGLDDHENLKFDAIDEILDIVEVMDVNDEDGLFEYLLKEQNLTMLDVKEHERNAFRKRNYKV